MSKIKLSEWADRNNLSYITANRHFHMGLIPKAVQLDSGTILIEDDTLEQNMANTTGTNDAMSIFLKKTVEFSKNNSTVEDFAAYVISNFQLKLNGHTDLPKYSKNKPKSEEVQKHFQQFLPYKGKEDQLKAIKNMLKQQDNKADGELTIEQNNQNNQNNQTKYEDMASALSYEDMASALSMIAQNVDLNIPFDSVSFENGNTNAAFQPTQKELLSSVKVAETSEIAPRRRGRKLTLRRDK